MATEAKRVLVYGATGSQSSPIVTKLLERGHRPYVLTRHPNKAAHFQQAGAEIIIGDMSDPASLSRASEGMDAVALLIPFFIANPLNAVVYGRNAIDAAKAAGVGLVVWNTSGVTPPARTGNPSVDVRIDITEYLQESGLPHIIIQPTGYIENLLGPWTAPAVVAENRLPYPNPALARVGWIASEDVGSLVVAALERPNLANASFQVSGLENVNGPELAARFSEVLGRDITYYAMEPEEFGAVLDKMFGPGAGAAVAEEYRKNRDNPNPPPMHFDMRLVLEKLPVEMTSISQWVASYKAAFTPA